MKAETSQLIPLKLTENLEPLIRYDRNMLELCSSWKPGFSSVSVRNELIPANSKIGLSFLLWKAFLFADQPW